MGFMHDRSKRKTGFRSEETESRSYTNRAPRDSGNKTLTKTVCAACGKSCQVPFKPNGEKPVYCNDCFRKTNSNFSDRKPSRFNNGPDSNSRDFRTNSQASGTSLEQINEKLDRILKHLE